MNKMRIYDTAYSTVLVLCSAIDAEVAVQLKSMLSDVKAPVNGRLIVDLAAAPYISSDGIFVLLNYYVGNNKHHEMEFRNASEHVDQLLDTAGLGGLIST